MTYRELLAELLGPDVTPDQLDKPVVILDPYGATLRAKAVGVGDDNGLEIVTRETDA